MDIRGHRFTNKSGLVVLLGCLLVFHMAIGMFSNVAHAAKDRTVKVAFFPMDGYNVTEADGTFGGMDVDYLNALCNYINWEIEYVPCDSWDDALAMLSAHEVDLVGSAQYSVERATIYQYANLSSGYTFGVIVTSPDSSLAYEDFEAMKSTTFGIVKTYVRRSEFVEYLRDNGVSNPNLKEYDSTADLKEALAQGEVDAIVHTFTETSEGHRLIGRFAPMPFYYISYQGNDDVMRELNQAIADLKINQPQLETDLMNKYYDSRLDRTVVFTTEEKAYLAEGHSVTVGYLDGYYPFSYENNGEYRGLTRRLLEDGAASVGLYFSYQKMDTLPDAESALQNGSIDIIAYCTDDAETLSKYQLTSVKEYASIPLVIVMKDSGSLGSLSSLATVPYLHIEASHAVDTSSVRVVTYDTQQECLDAVQKGTVDAVLCDGYLAEYLLSTELKYNKMEVKSVLSGEYTVSMVIRKSEDLALKGILSKTVFNIDAKTVSDYMMENNVYSLMTVDRFVRNNSVAIIIFLCMLIVAVILVAWYIISKNKKIQKLMYKDTGMDIWNLNYLIYWGTMKLLPERKEQQYAVAYLNISQFRHYNIIYGWNAGQRLLESVVDVLSHKVDERKEIYARNQGDRFVLLLAYDSEESLLARAEQLIHALEKRIYADTENRMAIHTGIYFVPQENSDLRIAVNYANQAMDSLRDSNVSEVKVYDASLEKAIKDRHEQEKLLDSVDINKDFVTYYQAKVDIRTAKIIGAEALIRFLDPSDSGRVKSPAFFVPYFEQTGRVTELDFFVLESVCKMLRRRLDEGKDVVTISCNFSRIHFMKPGFPERFEAVLEKYRISKEYIEVEVTETVVVEELQLATVTQTLNSLKEKGVRISIDDFGSGYSSLGVFEQIPASVIKLDRSFLLNQEDRGRQVKIMRGIVNLGKELNAQIVCEGVETDNDVELMQEIGAYIAQGYHYSKPIPEDEFEKKLDAD
ncbi:MAG: EAL domain-containing protein [Lachnospiraceae bacterium]|nr:EAL domain-containing protein [Lachnospiraceae bacterium]